MPSLPSDSLLALLIARLANTVAVGCCIRRVKQDDFCASRTKLKQVLLAIRAEVGDDDLANQILGYREGST